MISDPGGSVRLAQSELPAIAAKIKHIDNYGCNIFLKAKFVDKLQFIKKKIKQLPDAAIDIFKFRVDIITLQGNMRKGGEEITLLYVGRQWNLQHLTHKYFTNANIVESQRANLLTFVRSMKAAENRADVIFLDVGWPYHGFLNRHGDYLEMPDWMGTVIKVDHDWDNIIRRLHTTTRKNYLRLIRDKQYRCETSRDPELENNFYDKYYLPLISFRHAGDEILASRKDVDITISKGTIIRVIGEDGPVAVAVVSTEGDVLQYSWTGMLAEHIENPPKAAIAALYSFVIRFAFDRSLKAVDLMGTRGFPTDGVFQFKRRWGAVLNDSFSNTSILFKPSDNNRKAAIFSQHYPFLARRDGQIELVACFTGQEFGEAECKRVISNYYCEGINRVTVVHLHDNSKTELKSIPHEKSNVRVISCDLDNFSQHYKRDFHMKPFLDK